MNEINLIKPFRRYCITIGNLPTSFMESMTYYECLVWLVNFLENEVIPAVNNNGKVVEELQEKFVELKTYVDNYFDSLDVQQEINNKLDAMVEDGTLDTIISKYIVGFGINVKSYGAKGDDTTDDTTSINNAIAYAKNNGYSTVYFPKGVYKITDNINIDFSNFKLIGIDDVTLNYYGEGTSLNLITIKGNNANDYIENIEINNIKISGINQTYKGGFSMDTPKITSPMPLYKGIKTIDSIYVKNLTIKNCQIIDIYGEGIITKYCNDVKIINNKLYDVGAGNIAQNGPTGYDSFGDGIACFFSYNCSVSDNTIINKRIYQENRGGVNASGKLCGRSGLEYEYLINFNASTDNYNDPVYNCPDYENIPINTSSVPKNKREGSALRFFNNFVQGYTKGIHIEAQVKTIITNNSIVGNYINVLFTTNNEQIISNNYLNTYNVGKAPQSGYDLYSGNIAITQFTTQYYSLGMTIVNNSINGDDRGITLGRSNVNIENNNFTNKCPIYTLIQDLSNIIINGNTFKNYSTTDNIYIYLYHVNKVNLSNNLFANDYLEHIELSGDEIYITNNLFNNICINGVSNPSINIINNSFNITNEITNFRKAIIYGDSWKKLNLKDNDIDISNVNESRILYIDGILNNYLIDNNKIKVSDNQTLTPLLFFGKLNKSSICNNTVFGSPSNITYINFYNFIDSMIYNNYSENIQNTLINIGNSLGICKAFKNIGKINYGTMNASETKFINSYIQKGDIIPYYGSSTNNTFFGWYCQSQGYYVTTTWEAKTYKVNDIIKNSSNNVYQCVSGGNSTIEPSSTDNEFTTDDNITWKYLGSVAILSKLNI